MERKDKRGRKLKSGESQRKDGMYQFRYMDLDNTRKTVYSWKLVPSDKTPAGKKNDISLREKEKEIEVNMLNHMNNRGRYMTLNAMFDAYMTRKKYKGKALASKTKTNYRCMWDKHIKESVLGNKKISEIRKSDIVAFYMCLMEQEISYGTILFYNKLISAVFNMAIDDDIVSKNPAKRAMEEIAGKQKERQALTIAQQDELLRYAQKNDYNMYQKLIFALDTMCRMGEIAGITWDEIDMKKRLIVIDHQLSYIKLETDEKYTCHIMPTKSKKTRIIPMTSRVYKMLKDMQANYFVTNKGYEVDGKSNFLFYTKTGKLMREWAFNNELDKLVDIYNITAQNKIEHITPHILRHTGCTRNAEAGMDMKVLQYLMGHSSAQITNAVYNHVDVERASKEVEKIENERVCSA